MSLSNIERFDKVVGQVLADLYATFPKKVNLIVIEVDGTLKIAIKNGTVPINERTDELDFLIACVQWLVDAGYINARNTDYFGVSDAVLSAKCLEALKAMPASLDAPLGERLMEAANTESRHALRALVGQVLGLGLQWAVR